MTPKASTFIETSGVKIEPLVPFDKSRSKNALWRVARPSSSARYIRVLSYPPALTKIEYVYVWVAASPAEPVSNVSVPESNFTVSLSKVSKELRVKFLYFSCSVLLVEGINLSAVVDSSGAAATFNVVVVSDAVQPVALRFSGSGKRFVVETRPSILDVRVLALERILTLVGLLYQL